MMHPSVHNDATGRFSIENNGFTLIELSIVLVIIGLVAGGILVGRDMIRAAQIRSTITQVEQFNTASYTFRSKYNVIPGDLTPQQAAQFGFMARAGGPGRGDGNGSIQGSTADGSNELLQCGETLLFWQDLASAHLIGLAPYTGRWMAMQMRAVALPSPAIA